MSESILAAIIAGLFAFAGTCVTSWAANRKMQSELKTAQAVTDCKIDELTREVRMHNNFAQRIPVLEEQVKHLSEQKKSGS